MLGLGDLEAVVMNMLWRADRSMKVREVRDEFAAIDRHLAYTTVMTVLDNLHRKGWVSRYLDHGAYRYSPALSREEAASRALRQVLEESGNARGALLQFVRSASDQESSILEAALRSRR
ncbi:BlaI/MecI/CopY family transcriptional regulator [Nocardia pneumoniae]|uniref:BlaI/MecI/CopY family transcriptional regulator n=1 Tax=Nocardia pneumoniae TaxID=228601 RepID=UPI000313A388|nr:BlaI/MecI/CopY family transcriptional regulator [Nocardia pneumoniae]